MAAGAQLGRLDEQREVLPQHRLLQLLERRARLEPELVAQSAPHTLEDVERVGLAAASIVGEHQLRVEALPQRVLRDERLQLGDELRVARERELRLDPLLERREPLLL